MADTPEAARGIIQLSWQVAHFQHAAAMIQIGPTGPALLGAQDTEGASLVMAQSCGTAGESVIRGARIGSRKNGFVR